MPRLLLALLVCACASCGTEAPGPADKTATAAAQSAPAPRPVEASPSVQHLGITGTSFTRGGKPFEWRGITAFRLAEMMAHGRESEAIAFMDWATSHKLNVLRVLLMAKHLFELSPADGLRALPRLLTLAAERKLFVEVVVFADTAEWTVDFAAHVKAVSAVAAAHPNSLIEIANEPWHPTQDRRLHDPGFVRSLADLVPAPVPVAAGSGDGSDGYAEAGRYATWHSPRSSGSDGWAHVIALAGGEALARRWNKPIVSDEPIGAAESFQPGRRDNEPRRFAAAAVVTKLAGLSATFHYEGGLQARVPAGRELECFEAWSNGLEALTALEPGGTFFSLSDHPARAVFGRRAGGLEWLAGIDPGAGFEEAVKHSRQVVDSKVLPGVTVVRAKAQ